MTKFSARITGLPREGETRANASCSVATAVFNPPWKQFPASPVVLVVSVMVVTFPVSEYMVAGEE